MIKFIVFDDKMKKKLCKADTFKEALFKLEQMNEKHGNIVQTLEDGKEYYKAFGIKKGKVVSTIKYTEERRRK